MASYWRWRAEELGPLIGVVTSGARASIVPIRISRECISQVNDEMLVIIEDFVEGRRYLGTIKNSVKLDIAVDSNSLPTTFDPSRSTQFSAPMMKTFVEIIGEIQPDGGLSLSFAIPRPGSHVYRVRDGRRLAEILNLGDGLYIGCHKFSGLEIRLRSDAVDYHIAVLGATGTGKSRLVKALIEEIATKTGYSIVVFDHTGVDYADPSRWSIQGIEIVDASQIVLDIPVVANLLCEVANIPNNLEEHVFYVVTRYVIDQVMLYAPDELAKNMGSQNQGSRSRGVARYSTYSTSEMLASIDMEKLNEVYTKLCVEGKTIWSFDTFINRMDKYLDEINARESTKLKLRMLISMYAGRRFFENYLAPRRLALDTIVSRLINHEKKIIIVDLSTEIENTAKRYIVFQTLRKIWNYIAITRSRANIVAVIDEAHNYACHYGCKPCSTEIERTVREGRKWGFGVILASQRIIDLSPDIRGNINTVFFSRLQTYSDYQELKNWVEGAQYMEYTLPLLARREFFVAGLGNPFRKPVLVVVRNVS